jgi:glutamate-ammonia-ligase adenylyltransferase
MRQKMRAHLSSGGTHFDIKQDPGGIADIEFIAQYLVLNYAHDYPQLTEYSDNIRILTCAEQCHLIDPVEAQDLINAYQIFRCESHALALQGEDALSQHDLTTERDAVRRVWSRLLSENASGI